MLLVILSSILLNSQSAFAAIEPNYYVKKHDQVPFFKSNKSLFPSGATTLEKLKKHLVKTENSTDKFYQWNKIYFSQDELMPLFATHLSKYVIDNNSNERLKVVDTNTKSLQLYNEKYNTHIKVSIGDVRADAYDLGFAIALKDIYLKGRADEKSSILTTIPQGTRFQFEKFQNNFALIKYHTYTGYVSLSEVVTKFDLASFIYATGEWHQVKSRQFDFIVTNTGAKIHLNNVRGVITPDHMGIIASSSQKIPLWSKVKITKTNITTWQQSYLKEHGPVWWKPNKEFEQLYFSIDDILNREISFVSFHPDNPLKGLVSADGVYVTQNGYYWRKLPQFENYNGPVNYFSDQLLFVGNFRSTDGGATFENYIQIDKLASAIEFQYGFVPKKMQVKKIESVDSFKIQIEIDTGVRSIKMQSPLFTQNWKAAKS